jgi:hypothetical protein
VWLLVVLTTVGLTLPALPAPAKGRPRREAKPRRVASRVHAVLGALALHARPKPVRPIPTPAPGDPIAPEEPGGPIEEDAPTPESDPVEPSDTDTDPAAEEAEASPWVGPEWQVGRGPRRRGPTLPFDPAAASGSLASRPAQGPPRGRVEAGAPAPRDVPIQLCRFTC